MSKKSDRDYVLDAYYRGRARHFLDNLLIPMIRSEVQSPTLDVIGSAEGQYVVTSLLGADQRSGTNDKKIKYNTN